MTTFVARTHPVRHRDYVDDDGDYTCPEHGHLHDIDVELREDAFDHEFGTHSLGWYGICAACREECCDSTDCPVCVECQEDLVDGECGAGCGDEPTDPGATRQPIPEAA